MFQKSSVTITLVMFIINAYVYAFIMNITKVMVTEDFWNLAWLILTIISRIIFATVQPTLIMGYIFHKVAT